MRKRKGLMNRKNTINVIPAIGTNIIKLNNRKKTKTPFAINYYEKALDISSGDIMVYELLGDVYNNTGEKDEAIRCYEMVLKIDPDNVKVQNKLKDASSQK